MATDLEDVAQRFAVFAEQVLEPAVYPLSAALQVSVYQCEARIPYAEAVRQTYRPAALGWRWGPAWSTAWFRLVGRVDERMRGEQVGLRFSTETEALVWREGQPFHGLDANHQFAMLHNPSSGGEQVDLFVEAACNQAFGVTTFSWDPEETRRRWQEATPGRLTLCELAVFDEIAWRLWQTFEFDRLLMLQPSDDSARGGSLCDALRQAMACIDRDNVRGTAPAGQRILEDAIRGSSSTRTRCLAVGHAHIDTAWLWPIAETRRKCVRTFATVLELMNRFPDFQFLCSQAQHYAWLEQGAPELFQRIASGVKNGRWEAGGAMWVEPDCNVPSGESLVRQILHADRYWQGRFGDCGRQHFLYLPDSFGFPASLPQIMALAGLNTFITNKLCWNDTNEFPHMNFRWRGIDGTEVLAHCTPGGDYNAANAPQEFIRGETNATRKDRGRTNLWLQPFGFGDGGGGPTDWSILRARLAAQCIGLPEVKLASCGSFCEQLHERRAALVAEGSDLPVWDGELYLEYHRGTYTTQAWLKRANRQAEEMLRAAEILALAGPAPPEQQHDAATRHKLDRAWKLLLLNQFHDILPGSSITEVYDEARIQLAEVQQTAETIINERLAAWAGLADTRELRRPMLVFNPSSHSRSGMVTCEGRFHFVADVPPLAVAIVDRAVPCELEPARATDRTICNGVITAQIDEAGRVISLIHAATGRNACRRRPDGSVEPMNQLVLYEDRPRAWEAWDIDAGYIESPTPLDCPAASWQAVDDNPHRAVIEVTRDFGMGSRITQRFILEAGSPRLDIHTIIDWRENRRLLRALFPVNVRALRATYEIQLGHIERPTHRNTSWDQAMFEVCAHRWMDLSEPGFGVALLNDCKYGHSCEGHVMGLSLLRSPRFPDPLADIGRHEFTYSLMPHPGDWRAAGVDREADGLNSPFRARPLKGDAAPSRATYEANSETSESHPDSGKELRPLRDTWAPLTLDVKGTAGVQITALKRAEDHDGLVLRLAETHGGHGQVVINWNVPADSVQLVDLLERPMRQGDLVHDHASATTSLSLTSFQLVTLAAQVKGTPAIH